MTPEDEDKAIQAIAKALVAFFTGNATLYVGQLPITFKMKEEIKDGQSGRND